MADTEGKGFGGSHSARWIVLGVFLLAVTGGAYALLRDRLTASTDKQAELRAASADHALQVAVIPVEGMTCAACAARVKRTLQDIEGVTSAEVSLTERNVNVRYANKNLSSENLVAAINALGYKAQAPVAAEPKAEATSTTGALMADPLESQAATITIPVTGMACEGCAKTLEDGIRAMDGVTSVRVSHTEKNARIRFVQDKVSLKRITEEIDAHGFKAGSPVKEGAK